MGFLYRFDKNLGAQISKLSLVNFFNRATFEMGHKGLQAVLLLQSVVRI